MSFLRRLFGGDDDGPPPEPSGSPSGPVAVRDPEATLADHVGRLLARPELEFLIVEWDRARGVYLQFAPQASGTLHGETVGDRYLEPRHRLRDEQREALRGLGWHEARESGNWEQHWSGQIAAAEVARTGVATMAVYGVTPGAEWTITFGAD